MKIPGDTLLSKMPAELPSTEQISRPKLAVWEPLERELNVRHLYAIQRDQIISLRLYT